MEPLKIAFYGKGGIGKSTISSCFSAALASKGKRVLHIGCDPKADSTRSLTDKKIPTVLSQINQLTDGLTREDIVFSGAFGVSCIEAGGPQAGIGCAGMGITAMEEELHRLGILSEDWDVIVYDVLGDVVCGGFAVPMRKHYVDKVYVVSSADYMSLYAANNILKGIRSCSRNGEKLCGGLILNHCTSDIDRKIAASFADMTGIRLVSCIEESTEIKLADFKKKTVVELLPKSMSAEQMQNLAAMIAEDLEGSVPNPLSEPELDSFSECMFALRFDTQKGNE